MTSHVIRTRRAFFTTRWSEHGLPVQLQYATSRTELPESVITVPIIGPASDEVLGVIAVQSYAQDAYDGSDLFLLQDLAAATARVIETWRRRDRALSEMTRRSAELEAILASLSEGLMITDANGAIVRLNAAARTLLVPLSDSIVLGQPLDREPAGEGSLQGKPIAAALAELVGLLLRGEARQNVELDLWHVSATGSGRSGNRCRSRARDVERARTARGDAQGGLQLSSPRWPPRAAEPR